MPNALQNPLSFIGRLLLAVLFLPAGIGKLMGFAGTVGYITSAGMPVPEVSAAFALVIEIGGGLALIFGFRTRWVALVLAFFTLVASLYFHNYWALPIDQQMMMKLMFFKNIAVIGGLLTLAAWGPGAWSLDARRAAA